MKTQKSRIDRKEFLVASTGLVASAMVSGLNASPNEHAHHHADAKYGALIASAVDCLAKAEICANHCIASLKQKDLSLVDCLDEVREMLPLCSTLSTLAAYESKHLAAFARICISACGECMKECNKHAKTHKTCADCAEACKACIAECKKVA